MDPAGRHHAGGAASAGFQYNAANLCTQLTLPNGIVLAYGYDNDSRLTSMTWSLGNNPVGDLEYAYDADGRVTQKTGSLAATTLPASVSGNTFNAANEMTAFNGTTLTYDANGNLTNDGTNTYIWDGRNHLSQIAGSSAAAFQYDAFDRRAAKTSGGGTTQHLYDGTNPVQELLPGGSSANLLTGLDIDEFFARTDQKGQAKVFKCSVKSSSEGAQSPARSRI